MHILNGLFRPGLRNLLDSGRCILPSSGTVHTCIDGYRLTSIQDNANLWVAVDRSARRVRFIAFRNVVAIHLLPLASGLELTGVIP